MTAYTRKNWSDEEEQFLIDNASKMTISDVAAALNRTYNSVRRKAALLGVKLIESNRNNKLTCEEVAFIIDHGDTMTVPEMSSALSRSVRTIEIVAERHGVTIEKRAHHKWTDEELAELKELVEAGFHYEDIAQHFGVTPGSVSRKATSVCAKNGLRGRGRSRKLWGIDETRELVRMYENGDRVSEISEKLGRYEASITNKARKLGLHRPDMQ